MRINFKNKITGCPFYLDEILDYDPRRAIRKGAFDLIGKLFKGCCCFVAGTLVLSDNGLQAIETLKVGDLVYARDVETGETTLKPITELFLTENKVLYELVLQNGQGETEITRVTDNHPYWVIDEGWVESKDLQPGMQIGNLDEDHLTVLGFTALDHIEPTYNFTVGDFHTYFVGEQRALVHNCDCINITEKGLNRVEEHLDDVLKDQFPEFKRADQLEFQKWERAMLGRLKDGKTTKYDVEFYLHELKESAGFRRTRDIMPSHERALRWRNVESLDLFHPSVRN